MGNPEAMGNGRPDTPAPQLVGELEREDAGGGLGRPESLAQAADRSAGVVWPASQARTAVRWMTAPCLGRTAITSSLKAW